MRSERKTGSRKREVEVGDCVIQPPIVYWSLWSFSFSAWRNKLVCFLLQWLACASCEQCFQTSSQLSLFFFFFLLQLTWHSIFKWHNSLSACSICADRWRVLSWTTYSALWQLCQQKTKGDDDKWCFCHSEKTVQPSPSMNSCLEGNPSCVGGKKSSSVAGQALRTTWQRSVILIVWVSVCAQCLTLLDKAWQGILSGIVKLWIGIHNLPLLCIFLSFSSWQV